MKKNECEYFVFISADGNVSPVRVREDKHQQLCNLLDGEPVVMLSYHGGKYIFIADEDSSATVNYIASLFLGERGRFIRGAAVLCMIGDDGNYVGFEKTSAQHLAGVMNLLR